MNIETRIFAFSKRVAIGWPAEYRLACRVEAKHLRSQPFMMAARTLHMRVLPKEVLVVDRPKLLEYFARRERDKREFGHDCIGPGSLDKWLA